MDTRRGLLNRAASGVAAILFAPSSVKAEAGRAVPKSKFRFIGGAKSTGWIGFDMPENRFIMLAAGLNGQAVSVLLDTGAAQTVLDLPLAAGLALKAKGSSTVSGVTGMAAGTKIDALQLSIGNLVIDIPQAMALDLSPLRGATSVPITAVIGKDVFDASIVQIDFDKRKLSLRDQRYPEALSRQDQQPLLPAADGRREIFIAIEGGRPIGATFDLGSDTPLLVSPSYAKEIGLLSDRKVSTSVSVGAEGMEEDSVCTVRGVAVGGTAFREVPAAIPGKWIQAAAAVVGTPILKRFYLTIDYSRDAVWMAPAAGALANLFPKDRLGMAAAPETDCLRIIHIARGSPAERAGLRVGDEVIGVDGRPVDAAYFRERPRQGMRPAGTLVQFRLRSGAMISARLADYF